MGQDWSVGNSGRSRRERRASFPISAFSHHGLSLGPNESSEREIRASEPSVPSPWLRMLNAKCFSMSWQVSAAFEGYKGAVPLSPLCHSLNRSFLLPRLLRQDLLCARRHGAAVSQPCRQQRPIRPLESPGRAPIPLLDSDRVPAYCWSSRTPAVAASRSRSNTLPIVKMPHQQPCPESPASRPSISGPPDCVTPRSGDPETAE
jgi:hypothetical protein